MKRLRTLVWVYLWLLLFEGALRKWIVPSLDAPLLLVRDPVVIAIYFYAVRERLQFQNAFFYPNLILAAITAMTGVLFGSAGTAANVVITVYGLRTDYLQIPLIFLLPQILHRDDVITMGRFLMFMALPICALEIAQFRAPVDSWLNIGAMRTHYGTVRPSSTFSFVTGLGSFCSLTAAFLFYGYIEGRRHFKYWLLVSVTFAILMAAACSGSRGCLVSIGLVAVAAILCVFVLGRGGLGVVVATVGMVGAFALLSHTSVFQAGGGQLMQRFVDAGATEGNASGFIGRFVETFVGPLSDMGDVPLLGNGLGLGTNGAAAMLKGERDFNGPESEWGRLIWECGPLFGLLLCVFRTVLTVAVGLQAYKALRRGNMLPALIFAACGLTIFNGQWGVPTTLGFAIFGGGLVLAACEDPPEDDDHDEHDHDHGHEDHDEHDHDDGHERGPGEPKAIDVTGSP